MSVVYKKWDDPTLELAERLNPKVREYIAHIRECYAEIDRLTERAKSWEDSLHSTHQGWSKKYSALEAKLKEAEAKQRIDERQCDDMTSQAGEMAVELSALRKVAEAARKFYNLCDPITEKGVTAEMDLMTALGALDAIKPTASGEDWNKKLVPVPENWRSCFVCGEEHGDRPCPRMEPQAQPQPTAAGGGEGCPTCGGEGEVHDESSRTGTRPCPSCDQLPPQPTGYAEAWREGAKAGVGRAFDFYNVRSTNDTEFWNRMREEEISRIVAALTPSAQRGEVCGECGGKKWIGREDDYGDAGTRPCPSCAPSSKDAPGGGV